MSDLFGTDIFSEFDRLQRQISNLFGNFPSSLLASRSCAFPPVNIVATNNSIEIVAVAFAPGINAEELDVSIDKGLLTISGQRKPALPDTSDDTRAYSQEVFAGAFRRSWSCRRSRSRQGSGALRMTIRPAVDCLAPWTGMGTCAAEDAPGGRRDRSRGPVRKRRR